MFANREEAGKLLAKKLLEYKKKNTIVLCIPRGGVVVGFYVAKELEIPLDLIIPRKIGAPHNPEFALGAVTLDGTIYLNPSLSEREIPKDYLKEEAQRQINEIERRMKEYRGEKPLPDLKDKIVIIIDDGVATGSTVLAAISSVQKQKAKTVVLAVPVAPSDTARNLRRKVDRFVCLREEEFFYAVGQFYQDFSQTSDEEVKELLKKIE